MTPRPRWVDLLPAHIKFSDELIATIERRREFAEADHAACAVAALSHPEATRSTLQEAYRGLRLLRPRASNQELFLEILQMRIAMCKGQVFWGGRSYISVTDRDLQRVVSARPSLDEIIRWVQEIEGALEHEAYLQQMDRGQLSEAQVLETLHIQQQLRESAEQKTVLVGEGPAASWEEE